ncbi:hypothetical protein N3K66_005956 [Trichothecium roseum]|uniref:Uncharacterized protein n=1 Tax=Trichothecium roseum TaxID=47278 RepID=A0ACC0V206_9HYPO|nr:hypothetical protein N3K66_005956 [Trichothecium roseum]
MSAQPLPNPTRIVSSNVEATPVPQGRDEPGVETKREEIELVEMFDGKIRRGIVARTTSSPASNAGPLDDGTVAGSGIVQPGGVHSYFLDLAPGFTTPMHRTVSTDFLMVQKGTPTIITPKGAFSVGDGNKGDYAETEETACAEGDVIVQRGQMHALSNRTDSWVRFWGVIVDAKVQEVKAADGNGVKTLEEIWLQN